MTSPWPRPQRLTHLVLDGDLGAQGVVGVPLLGEGQSVLRTLVLGLQGSGDLAGLGVGGAGAGELLQTATLVASESGT